VPAWRGRHQFGDGNLEIGPVEVDRFASPEPADYLQELVEKRSTPCEIDPECGGLASAVPIARPMSSRPSDKMSNHWDIWPDNASHRI